MRVDGGEHPYPASRDATTPFFFLAFYRPMTWPRHPKGKRLVGDTMGHQGKATAVMPDNAARGSLLTWTAVEIYSPAGA